ncbi:hypothetical protein MTR_4g058780 [Medicago truncatula]|uniref:Uncharacterized protein n=1 Tax=Medicago truncatula TaxID=3880 RepID=A0A072UJZ9_MEDTR|nr:hypothetical protein MTR_4g058780 [Medicago truncatula]
MVLESLQDSLGHLLSCFHYRTTTIYVHEPSPIVLVVRVVIFVTQLAMKTPIAIKLSS